MHNLQSCIIFALVEQRQFQSRQRRLPVDPPLQVAAFLAAAAMVLQVVTHEVGPSLQAEVHTVPRMQRAPDTDAGEGTLLQRLQSVTRVVALLLVV